MQFRFRTRAPNKSFSVISRPFLKRKYDGQTNRSTDQPTDEPTDRHECMKVTHDTKRIVVFDISGVSDRVTEKQAGQKECCSCDRK